MAVTRQPFVDRVYEKHKGALISLGLSVIVIILLTGYLVRYFLKQSFQDINSVLERYGAGDYTRHHHATQYRDFQPVQDGILNLGEQIDQHIQQLQEYQLNLEGLVEERTVALVEARDQAEAANRAKSDFLANMSHELRTPLNAVLGFSEIMHDTPGRSGDDRKNLEIISRAGKHLLLLINDVLDMSKIEAGHTILETEDFDLGELTQDVVEMMRVRAEKKGLQLILDQSSDFPRLIHGDGSKLRQIFINLLSNAVKFTDVGGISLRLDTINDSQDGITLRVEVEDTGSGISSGNIERIFTPFEQLATGVNREGTGLGLSITRQFVELMGGTIEVESKPGHGSIFRFTVQVQEARGDVAAIQNVTETHHITGLAPGQPEYRILIVEDIPDNQLLLQCILEAVDLHVRIAENGEEAIRIFQEWHPHFIWMDRRMPVMGGMEATRKIRELPGGKDVKIVAITASVFSDEKNEVLEAGSDDFLRKPYRAEEVYNCLANQLGVRYSYEDETEKESQTQKTHMEISSEALAKLPENQLFELRTAALALDIEQALAVIEQIKVTAPSLGEALQQQVESLDFETLQQKINL